MSQSDRILGNFFKRIVGGGTMTAKVDHYRDKQIINIHDIGIFQNSKTYYEKPYDKNGEPNYYPIFFYPYIELRMVSGRTYYIMTEKEEQLDEIINIAKGKCNHMRCYDEPSKCRYITDTLNVIAS